MRALETTLQKPAYEVAQRLLGSYLERKINGQTLTGKIVETEAYEQSDAASHRYKGETPRTSIMFGPAGFAYVYFTYGMHYCMNVVTGVKGEGSAVLIRALEPREGKDLMRQNRQLTDERQLTSGPAKLCQALAITKQFNGHNLEETPLKLVLKPKLEASQVVATTRIGINHDTHRIWRFYIRDNQYISKP